MKKFILSSIAIALSFVTFSQAPNAFKYQAVVRDAANLILNNQSVGMRMTIMQGSIGGTTVYQETFASTTNAYGLVNLEIGSGTVVSGDFTNIDWASGPYFIETAVDVTGGTAYVTMGTSQLMSVPYALHANTAENVLNDAVDDADNDPTNEIETWATLAGIPADIADGDDNTQLSEAEVDAYVANNGYLMNLSGVSETMIEGSWSGGIGDGASGVLGVIPSHRTLHFDVVFSSHDINSNTNRKNMHKEFIAYREWTNPASFQDLIIYYDQETGANITVTFGTNANNEITYNISQVGGSGSLIYYKMSVKLLSVAP